MAFVPLMLMTPPLPPSGPVWGHIECLFGSKDTLESASLRFNEAGLQSGPFEVNQVGQDADQVQLAQFPVDGAKLSDAELTGDGTIMLHGEGGRRVLGKFTPLKPSSDDRWWMDFATPGSTGELTTVGKCLGEIRGRLERPIRLTKITTVRVD